MSVRRPRIPEELAERIDHRRGLVSFEPFVRFVLDDWLKRFPDGASEAVLKPTGDDGLYGCRRCEFTATSPKARCPSHGGALVPTSI